MAHTIEELNQQASATNLESFPAHCDLSGFDFA
jgi:hypothetical protein